MKTLPYRFLVVASLIMLCGCSRKAPNEDQGGATRPPVVDVRVSRVASGDMEEMIVVEGTTDALRRERIASPIAGVVVSMRGIAGSAVRAGDTLAVIRSRESQAAIDGANFMLRAAKTEAQRAEARRSYELAVSSQNAAAVRSTRSGIIASRGVNEGELVAQDAELFTIIDLSSIYFAASVPLRDLAKVHPGQTCRIRFASMRGTEIPATVSAIEPAADEQSQSVRARLSFEQVPPPERALLKTDMFGTARIVVGMHRGVLLVPRSAVLRNDETNETSLVLVSPDSLAVTLPVTVGIATDSLVEVSGSGLAEGQLVIVEGNYGLPDSTKVRVTATEKQ
jgi:RND family efflux transporter MFP subunit